ncbi:MAG: helix-turn-helix transcriptional regulator [Tepidiformaceae bacterium]
MSARGRKVESPGAGPEEGLLSVREAARVLRVSESTIWRWIGSGQLPAVRIGPKRVWLRAGDVAGMIRPVTNGRAGQGAPRGDGRAMKGVSELTVEQQKRGLAAVESARRFQKYVLAKRGSIPWEDSAELIRQMRDERSAEL